MEIRLSKHLADQGLCSRREADYYIEQGWVTVNGQIAVLGLKVNGQENIVLDPRARKQMDSQITIVLHKPVGYVSGQAEHGYSPASTLITNERHWSKDPNQKQLKGSIAGLAPAGRLDIDSTGILVLTQNGRIARSIIGEDSDVEKEYLVRVSGQLSPQGLAKLNHGLSLDGKALKPAVVTWQNDDQLRFVLKEGKKRQIRRMCELVGLKVLGLKRVRIGRLMLGHLPYGQWRYLAPNEKIS